MINLTRWGIHKRLHTVAETPTFCRQAEKLFDTAQRLDLILALAADPLAGVEIPGSGGVRKMRFRARGQGKRGGARIIYFFGGDWLPVYALLVYAKSAKTGLSPAEQKQVAAIAAAIKANWREAR